MNQTIVAGSMIWLKRLGILIGALVILGLVAVIVFQRISDGPYGMLQGGPFQSGEIVAAGNADYSVMAAEPTELLLVGPGTSRTLGYFMHDGKVYISCDLGFM